MSNTKKAGRASGAKQKLKEAVEILTDLGFGPKQSNELAGYVLLALLDLKPQDSWKNAAHPLRGITPIIEFIAQHYRQRYAPNTRETVRDEAVKHFVEHGLLMRNPDDPARPTNSGNTVYQVESTALELLKYYGSPEWPRRLKQYRAQLASIKCELDRKRTLAQIPVTHCPAEKSWSFRPEVRIR